jgi:hypothetical protein
VRPVEPDRRWTKALEVALLAIAAIHGAYQLARAATHPKQGVDFAPEYVAARMLAEGDRQFYDLRRQQEVAARVGVPLLPGPDGRAALNYSNYSYPPWLALAYFPISRLPYNLARRVWLVLATLAYVLASALLGAAAASPDERGAPTPERRRRLAVAGVAAALLFFPGFYGLFDGQSNDFQLLGLAAGLALLRRGRPVAAGLVLAPASMVKLFPGIVAIFLAARREWRALGGLAAGCAAIVLASLPAVGIEGWRGWLVYLPTHNAVDSTFVRNQSIAGALARLLTENADAPPIALAPGAVRPLRIALEALAATLALVALIRPATRREPRYAVQFGTMLVLAVLITPKAWEHYGIFLLPAFLGILGAAEAGAAPLGALALAGVAFAVWGLLYQQKDDYAALARGALVLFIPAKTVASGLLLAACAWVARDGAAAPAERAPDA